MKIEKKIVFEPGDKVRFIPFGEKVFEVLKNTHQVITMPSYPICIWVNGNKHSFTADGRIYSDSSVPLLEIAESIKPKDSHE